MERYEHYFDKEKEELLQQKPLLRFFLDENFSFDFKKWEANAAISIVNGYREIESVKGKQWDDDLVATLHEGWNHVDASNKQLSFPQKRMLLATFIMIGYELGKTEALQIIADDIQKKSEDIGLIDDKFQPNIKKIIAQEFLFGVLQYGVNLKDEVQTELQLQQHPRSSKYADWGVFKDFIENELDMEGI